MSIPTYATPEAPKTQVGTLDLTPTWEAIAPLLTAALIDGNTAARVTAAGEIRRMAKLADLYVASQRPRAPVEPHENIGSL